MRFCFVTCCILAFIMSQPSTTAADNASEKVNVDVWIGTGSSPQSKGVYHCMLNTHTGKLTNPTLAAEMSGPGFLAMHPSEKVVYAVGGLEGKQVVAAYTIDGEKLSLINSLEIGDGGAAHVSVDPTGKMLLTAQYGGGSVAAFSLNEDGSLKERTALIKHEGGSGVVPGRQDASHAHWTGFSPDNRFAFVPDLGLDKVVIYKVDLENATLTPHGYGKVPSGGGPRHMKFHPSGKFVFVLNELSLSVTVFDYNAETGTMTPKQTIPTVSKQLLAKEKFKSCSEIRVHPSGQFVFAANRGHDTVTVFRVNQSSGQLSVIEVENARAVTPRNINLDPTGNWLLAAGQDSHTLASFNVDGSTGELTYNQSIVVAPSAICVMFEHE
ncbi:6-phosphogluconolactonase [Rubripirellula reticaptiva]|uniref:6-phosphogluconolactonase n=2 Tax=Rubripirellula reticaptiva TaxID=2528013 RepID=A0A5C6EJE2_9BACT|nr:6-phosphogluconolactonase [Rubripirellula reticaptiva]